MRPDPIRNPTLVREIERAVDGGHFEPLFALLCRFSGLPGPRANMKLASAVGHEIAARGSKADRLVTLLCSVGLQRSVDTSPREFLPIVGAFSLAARISSSTAPEAALTALRALADDSRHLVRQAVVCALVETAMTTGEDLVRWLARWTDGYLSAAVALEAITSRSSLDALRAPDEAIARLDESFSLVESAPRADQRSQGYRTLLTSGSAAAAKLLDRFPQATAQWLETKASTDHVELRRRLGDLATGARAGGHPSGELERFEKILQASAPPRRDPRTYVGPTRKRGARRR